MTQNKPYRLLAIDTSASPGFAVISVKDGVPKLEYVDSIKTDTSMTDAERFSYVEATVMRICYEKGRFDEVVREHFVKGGSKRATQLVFGAWSAIDMALARFGYVIPSGAHSSQEITNSRVKSVVGKHGGASKKTVEEGVRILFNLRDSFEFKSDDESDAAAIGYTYLYDKGMLNNAPANE